MTALSSFAQGVKVQAFTTNSGPVVTNIVINLSSNLAPNRLRATNTITGVRVYAATNGLGGFWLDPSTISPGSATNVIDVAAGNGINVVTNSLLRTISIAPEVTNQWRNDINAQMVRGTNIFVGTNFTGNGSGLTNLVGNGSGFTNLIADSYRNLYVAPWGNDSTARRGDLTKPWRRVYDYDGTNRYGVLSVATNGDSIWVMGSNYTAQVPLQTGQTLSGLGLNAALRFVNTNMFTNDVHASVGGGR